MGFRILVVSIATLYVIEPLLETVGNYREIDIAKLIAVSRKVLI